MIAAAHQPQYLPWLGYFHKLATADVFCLLDNVQYKKNEWQNRNRIKTAQGWQWLSVPVGFRFPQRIDQVTVDNRRDWQKKHLAALRTNYGRAAFFEEVWELLLPGFSRRWERLAELNAFFIGRIAGFLGLGHKPLVRASSLELAEHPTERLVDICRRLGADTYLSGPAGADYMDLARFEAAGIRVVFQDFRHPVYPQLFGDFEPRLSVVDALFNCGRKTAGLLAGAGGAGDG